MSNESTDDFAGDALAGVAFWKGRKEIHPTKIGLLGQSEGRLIALLAGSRSRDVAFIVLMAGAGLSGIDILQAQGELIARAERASEPELKYERKAQQLLFGVVLTENDERAARTKLAGV